ncbi:site-specific DNA-methyltransferase [Bacteroidales bacterium OttesenSCG-928-I14]|nr:site-specific DNA-methyltransferase [Bacteroidales bacterium OttesenSCG-928-I14]
MLNNNFSLNNQGVSNAVDTKNLPRHRWYYYKEGFSPNLVEKAIEYADIKTDDIILDPFNGSGTTTLTASLNGYKSIGIEVNPFTSFLSSAKIGNSNLRKLKNAINIICDNIIQGENSKLKGFSTFSKTENIDKWLFNDGVLDAFCGGFNAANKLNSESAKQLIKLALISSAMQNCNATRDGKCLRYRDNWESHHYNDESFLHSFIANMDIILEDIEQEPIEEKPNIITGDARVILSSSNTAKFNLCITSPPYLNTFDYTDIYRPELFLGQFINSKDELYNLRLRTVRSHIQAKWKEPKLFNFGELYKQSINHIYNHEDELMHKRIPMMVQAYFEDMLCVLNKLRAKAEKNAQLWFVVSNSAYANKEIPVDLIIADISRLANWKLKEVGVLREIKRRKTKHSPDISTLRESVIILTAK